MTSRNHGGPDGPAALRTDEEADGQRRLMAPSGASVALQSRMHICSGCATQWERVGSQRRHCPLCGRPADVE